jgi:predicted GNAT family acetyltransferase
VDVPVSKDYLTYGIIIDDEVASRASIVEFTDTTYPISDIVSVYTVPRYRRRGFAKAVVSTCTTDILSRGRIPTYSAEVENLASLHTCMAVGYHPYGESLEILGHLI